MKLGKIFSTVLSYFLIVCFSWSILSSHNEAANECLESKLLLIPVCHAGAICLQTNSSYVCSWGTNSNYTNKSPYISLNKLTQPDIPTTWQLPTELPPPSNECVESILIDKYLCQIDAICEDQHRGYKCYYFTPSKEKDNPYMAGVCETVDKNWVCPPSSTTESKTSGEKTIEDLNNQINVIKELDVSTMTLNEVIHTVDLSMNVSQNSINLAEEDRQKANEKFVNTVKLFDQAILNLAHKLKSEQATLGNFSFQTDSINILLRVLPGNTTKIAQTFGEDNSVSLSLSPSSNGGNNLITSFSSVRRDSSILSLLNNVSADPKPIADIIGVTLYSNVSLDIILRLQHEPLTEENKKLRHCGYWRPEEKQQNLLWSYDGCLVNDSASGSNFTICQCSHLTYFSVIFDLNGNVETNINENDSDLITPICCTICILTLTILLLCMWRLNILQEAYIQTFLCLCLILGNFTFLIGMYMVSVSMKHIFCPIFAILSVYFFMSAFSFKFIYGLQLTRSLLRSYHAGPTTHSKRKRITALGFCVPLIIVVISVAVRFDDFGTAKTSCWIRVGPNQTILSFFIPVLFVIAANVVNLALVSYKLLSNRTARKALHRGKATCHQPSCNFNEFIFLSKATLFMGLTWLSGYLVNVESIRPLMAVMFPIFNALQGVALLIHVFISKKHRGTLVSFLSQMTSSDSNRESLMTTARTSLARTSALIRESTSLPRGKRQTSSSTFVNPHFNGDGRDSTIPVIPKEE